ncbi:hypothetical protein ABZX39_02485, partial [Streptomyces collinus]|uniref:hypothetical protein n=1 Tax=Streptomyces collinus TaxID=42684 RepID=UPI0033BDCC40
ALGSALALVALIETPGVSGAFGCTPLGPVARTRPARPHRRRPPRPDRRSPGPPHRVLLSGRPQSPPQ